MESMHESVSIEKALELTGYGKYTILLTLACGFCLFGVNCEVYSISYILPAAECDLKLDTTSKSMITGACLSGMILSTNLWGFLSDRKGRKNVIILCGIAGFLSSTVAALSNSLWPFIIFKFLGGVFIAGPSSGVFAYAGEFLSSTYRSRSIIFCGLLACFAMIYSGILSWILLPLPYTLNFFGFEYRMWRIYLLLNCLPIGIASLFIYFFPESPKFLLSIGNREEALNVLRTMYEGNTAKSRLLYPVTKIVCEEEHNKTQTSSFFAVLREQTIPLFNKHNLWNTTFTSYLQFGNYVVSSGLLLWYGDILKRISENSSGNDLTVCEAITQNIANNFTDLESCNDKMDESIFRQNLWIGVAYLIGYVLIILALKFCRKVYIMSTVHLISCASTIAVTYVTIPKLIDVLFIILLVLPGICVPTVTAFVVDLFPTHLRATAVSFCSTFGRLGSVISSSVVGYLLQVDCVVTFFLYATCLLSCACVSAALSIKDKPTIEKN